MAYDDKKIFDPTSLGQVSDPNLAKEEESPRPFARLARETAAQITVVAGKSDMERAQEYRDQLNPHLQAICDITTEARKRDILLNFQFNIDGMGRTFVTELTVMKKL